MIQPRPYQDERDLERMLSLLAGGRQADNDTYYVHTGDLKWWLFYTTSERWQDIFLWEQDSGGDLHGWALLSPEWRFFDVFVQPGLHGSPQAEAMFAWAEQATARIVAKAGGKEIRTMWISEEDDAEIDLLQKRGFILSADFMRLMARPLEGAILEPGLPEGYRLRHVAGEHELENRAAAQYAAFENTMPFDAYSQRYLRFMRSPVYTPDLDIVATAPDGRIAAFCIVWPDALSRVGLFEPVGTHPEFQRKGLGRAVVYEGLRRLRATGMQTAIVCAVSDNPAAYHLYESAGFRSIQKISALVKEL